jgi:hypothetical protein
MTSSQNSKEHEHICERLNKLHSKKKFSKDMLSIIKVVLGILLKQEREKMEPETWEDRVNARWNRKELQIEPEEPKKENIEQEKNTETEQMEKIQWQYQWETRFEDMAALVSNKHLWTAEDTKDWRYSFFSYS